MLRADSSPVKDRIKQIADGAFPSSIKFAACGNTKKGMEKHEGHAVSFIPQATEVPSGAVRLMELQGDGWAYLRP
jgi:intracellular sulfur oxidation DsrE/DsrF family protein